jgi:hypothetical protein
MAIYQAPRKRWRLALALAVVGAVAGLLIGLALGGGGNDDPLASLRILDTKLEEAAAPLDVLALHGQAGTGATDERIVTDALARTTARFDEVRAAVRAIDPEAEAEFDEYVDAISTLADDDADPEEIADEADELADLLRDLIHV